MFAAIPLLVATRSRMTFTSASYVCLFVFFILHAIGAHYTYALVPYDRWSEAVFGSTVSEVFALGTKSLRPIRALPVWRTDAAARDRAAAAVCPCTSCMAMDHAGAIHYIAFGDLRDG